MNTTTPHGTEAYAAFVKDELEAQEKRKASFEQRGLSVITTAGVLVTFLFALAALSTRTATAFELPDSAQDWLSISLVLFGLAALFALLTNAPLRYEAVDVHALRERLREQPPRTEAQAHRDIALTRLKALEDAKRKNGIKGVLLVSALACEAAASVCVALAVGHIL